MTKWDEKIVAARKRFEAGLNDKASKFTITKKDLERMRRDLRCRIIEISRKRFGHWESEK